MCRFPNLFEPFAIPPVPLRNRITMAPLFTAYAHRDGTVSELTLLHYREVACGGAAMVVVANCIVDPSGIWSKRSLRADDDRFVPGLQKLAETIKQEGATAVLQLNHGGRFAKGKTLYAPSSISLDDLDFKGLYQTIAKFLPLEEQLALALEAMGQLTRPPREMSIAEIDAVIAAYARAAVRAQRAGFDMVEIHGATGYLPVQFLSPRTNRRKDGYGGELENRMRFPLELVEAVKGAVGHAFPVGYRFTADEGLPYGFSLKEARVFARKLSDNRVAYLSVTGGTYESSLDQMPHEESQGHRSSVDLAQEIKKVTHLPVIASGGIKTPTLAETILKEKKADLVGLARSLFADPLWPQKAHNGQENAIVLCKDCRTCFKSVVADKPAFCLQWDRTRQIKRKRFMREEQNSATRMLITMDGSESSFMAAAYAANMISGRKDMVVTIIHIQTDEFSENEKRLKEMMDQARSLFSETGTPEDSVTAVIRKKREDVASDILREIKEGGYGTVVLGRRGLSKTKQFLFGSVSNKVMQNASNCAIWIVD
jgi:2,4-dienoyl-CoA reductase-like NADH-dependent reductase (Old Yellow Enzyme family)/nucleotide-binding universal stress UspA family protein